MTFDLAEADLGVHPFDKTFHSISFYCDDIKKTVEALEKRGVEFTTGISDEGWGLLTHFRLPGDLIIELYQPKYEKRARQKSSKTRTVPKGRAKTRKKIR